MFKKLLLIYLLSISTLIAGLPPTSSKISGESVYSTTFKTDFGTFKGTRSGTTLTLNSIGAGVGDSLVLGGTKAASAILDVQSTTQGVLPPRMTTAQMNAISSPANGLTIYNTDYNSLASYNSTSAVWTYGFGSLNVESPWVACTFANLTWQGLGGATPVTNNLQCRINATNLEMKGTVTVGTVSGSLIQFPLPTNYGTIVTQSPTVLDTYGVLIKNAATVNVMYSTISTVGLGYFQLSSAIVSGSVNRTTAVTGSSSFTLGEVLTFENISIPIAGWGSNTSAWVLANSNPTATTTEFSAQGDLSAVVSAENVDWISGNCTNANPSVCTLSIANTLPMVCTATPNNSSSRVLTVTSTSTTVSVYQKDDTGVASRSEFSLKCDRVGADYAAAHSPFILGTFAGTPNVPGYTGSIDTFSVSYGATATTDCTTGTCAYVDAIGAGFSVSVSGTTYTLTTPKTYAKLKCDINGVQAGAQRVQGLINGTSSASFTFTTAAGAGAAVNSYGNISCQGTY